MNLTRLWALLDSYYPKPKPKLENEEISLSKYLTGG